MPCLILPNSASRWHHIRNARRGGLSISKALHIQKTNSWARFISLQHTYNLINREEEREILPLCLDEGVQTIVYSPLARGRLARPWGAATARSEAEPYVAALSAATAVADEAVVNVLGEVAAERGVNRAQIALSWLHRHPVVAASIVGALKTSHIDDAIAALSVTLTDAEVERLQAPYTPRTDAQGVSDPAVLARMAAAVGIKLAA